MNEIIAKTKIQRNVKDTLFRFIFASNENKDSLLSLVNALFDTSYNDISAIEVTTMEDVIFINSKNDLSIILEPCMYLFEQQSTVNPNMPLRGFMYFAHLYEKYTDMQRISLYSGKKIMIPSPRYVVLYNGKEELPARQTLRLSDSFKTPSPGFEWTATLVNINSGINEGILDKCDALRNYMTFVNKAREYSDSGMEIKDAIIEATDYCIRQGIMADFLKRHRAEALDMVLTEFDQEKYERSMIEFGFEKGIAEGETKGRAEGIKKGRAEGIKKGRAEGIAEGEAKGMKDGKMQMLIDLVNDKILSLQVASLKAGMTEAEFAKLL